MTAGEDALLEWGWAGAALAGASGDLHVVAPFEGGVLAGVIDGLGHGPEAAEAARAAGRVLAAFAGEPLPALVERCHEALRRTRGAVLSVASFAARPSRMTWGGVGNVEGVLLRAPAAGERAREAIPTRGGIVGYHLPAVPEATLALRPGDTVILATDGIRAGFWERLPPAASPQALADAVLARDARGSDDALVLVARWRGAPGAPGPGGAPDGGGA